MNRSLPALILLLGTLGGSIVALGVARDLERVGRRPANDSHVSSSAHSVSFGRHVATPEVTIRSEALGDQSPLAGPPLRYEDDVDFVADAIDLLDTAWLRDATAIVNRSTEWLARTPIADTTTVDALIAENDGLIAENDGLFEKNERDRIPYGIVAIGPDRTFVELQYRGDLFVGELLWTGSLHYGGNAQQTLGSTVATTAPIAQAARPLPWDKLVLWSSDRRALTSRCTSWVTTVMQAGIASIELVGTAGDAVTWVDRQIGRSWDRLAVHVKRDLWLVNAPAFSAPMRSAELPQGDKR